MMPAVNAASFTPAASPGLLVDVIRRESRRWSKLALGSATGFGGRHQRENQQSSDSAAIRFGVSDQPANPVRRAFGRAYADGIAEQHRQRGHESCGSCRLEIYCTGLGDVTNRPANARPRPQALLFRNSRKAHGNRSVPALVSFSGLVPNYVGLYEVNRQVPANALRHRAGNDGYRRKFRYRDNGRTVNWLLQRADHGGRGPNCIPRPATD
jgi:hypothetical protein